MITFLIWRNEHYSYTRLPGPGRLKHNLQTHTRCHGGPRNSTTAEPDASTYHEKACARVLHEVRKASRQKRAKQQECQTHTNHNVPPPLFMLYATLLGATPIRPTPRLPHTVILREWRTSTVPPPPPPPAPNKNYNTYVVNSCCAFYP